jgi:hypothetical protein
MVDRSLVLRPFIRRRGGTFAVGTHRPPEAAASMEITADKASAFLATN